MQAIFSRYLALGSVGRLREVLGQEGVRGKRWVSAAGRSWGGTPLARGALYTLLRNRLYLGEITHKGRSYPGQHAPIIERSSFDRVQALLTQNAGERGAVYDALSTAPLQPSEKQRLCECSAAHVSAWANHTPAQQRALLLKLVNRVELSGKDITIRIRLQAIATLTDA